MLSTCPSCLAQINHPDHLFEVECRECGGKFNPFLSPDDSPPSQPSSAEAQNDGERERGDSEFSESNATFQDIRDYGEGLLNEAPSSDNESNEEAEAPQNLPQNTYAPSSDTGGTEGEEFPFLVLPASLPSDLKIERYLSPLSLCSDVDLTGSNPLAPVFTALEQLVRDAGANAVCGVQWSLFENGTRCLMSGLPVKYRQDG